MLGEALRLFVGDCPRRVAAIGAAVAARNAERLHAEGHDLKGAAGTLSASRLVAAARALECVGRDGHLDDAEIAGGNVTLEIERLMTLIGCRLPAGAGLASASKHL